MANSGPETVDVAYSAAAIPEVRREDSPALRAAYEATGEAEPAREAAPGLSRLTGGPVRLETRTMSHGGGKIPPIFDVSESGPVAWEDATGEQKRRRVVANIRDGIAAFALAPLSAAVADASRTAHSMEQFASGAHDWITTLSTRTAIPFILTARLLGSFVVHQVRALVGVIPHMLRRNRGETTDTLVTQILRIPYDLTLHDYATHSRRIYPRSESNKRPHILG